MKDGDRSSTTANAGISIPLDKNSHVLDDVEIRVEGRGPSDIGSTGAGDSLVIVQDLEGGGPDDYGECSGRNQLSQGPNETGSILSI